jgi:sigma-E factor negative regulatory protein RseB
VFPLSSPAARHRDVRPCPPGVRARRGRPGPQGRPPGPCPRGGVWGGRPPGPALLLVAAFTLAVPGLLVAACSGQAGSSHEGTAPAAGPGPGSGGQAPATPGPPGSAHAARLLTQAAQAAVLTSYQGEEIVSHWGTTGGSVLVSDIWHASGGQTVTRTLAAGTYASTVPYLSADTDARWPEGVLGVTIPLVRLLETHYIVAYEGPGSADNRTAEVVDARRGDGSLAARFWLDDATKLPLEREVFDAVAHVISEDVFINVRITGPGPVAPPAGGLAVPQGPWPDPLSAAQLLALRTRGWLVPPGLPGGLSLFTGAQAATSTGTVIDLCYSDGLSVVSVFEQHGNLAAKLAGWQKATVAGHVIYVAEPDQRSLTWSSHGMVYTVIADAPAQTVDAVVGVLPHDAPPGFWKRMSRGLARMASWANPFG